MDNVEAKKISLFQKAAEDYKKSIGKRQIALDQGQNGLGHDLKLIYRSAELSSSLKQIVVHFTKREEYRKILKYRTVNYKKKPVYGETVRKESEVLIKLPYRYENASYLEEHLTPETRPCKNNIITSVFEPKHWSKEIIEEVGRNYLNKIETKEGAKIDEIDRECLKAITDEKYAIEECEKKNKHLQKKAKRLSKKLEKTERKLSSAEDGCPAFLAVITLGIALLSHGQKACEKYEKRIEEINSSIQENKTSITQNDERKEKAKENISLIQQNAERDISKVKDTYREDKKAAYFFKSNPELTLALLNETSSTSAPKVKVMPVVTAVNDGEEYDPETLIDLLSEGKGKVPGVFLITLTPINPGITAKPLHYVDTSNNLLSETRAFFSPSGEPIDEALKKYRWSHRYKVTVYAYGHIVDKDEQAQEMYLKMKELMKEHDIHMGVLE